MDNIGSLGMHNSDYREFGDWLARYLELSPIEGEGGLLRRLYGDDQLSSAVFLMVDPDFSALHQIDTTEVYHWQGGSPIQMLLLKADGEFETPTLGPDIERGQLLQIVVPAGTWQGSRPCGAWSLAGLTLSPPFRAEGFTLGEREALQARWPDVASEIERLTRLSWT